MHKHSVLSVARDLSRFPAGRFKKEHGIHSGEAFKELIAKKLQENDTVTVLLNDTMGFGSSWIEEAFGGLVRDNIFSASDLHKKLTIEADDKSLITEAWSYIDG